MQYVQLGKTDLRVSRICFGCWQLSPKFWGEVSQEEWRKAVHRALDLGINFVDTADAYGDGMAESVLGSHLKKENLRDRLTIATKFYWNFYGEKRYPDTSYDYILRACNESLKRLQVETIDLYQIHAWDPLTSPEEVAAAFSQLKKEGKVRWFGVSNLNADQMRMYLSRFDVECLQPGYSLLSRDVEAHELPLCVEKRIGVIAYSPLFRGLLTGKYERDHQFSDSRANAGYFQGEAFQKIMDGIDKLRPLAEKHGLTVPQLAIRWVLTHPAVSCAIVGIKTAEHIETIVPAAENLLPRQDWQDIAAIISAAKAEADSLL